MSWKLKWYYGAKCHKYYFENFENWLIWMQGAASLKYSRVAAGVMRSAAVLHNHDGNNSRSCMQCVLFGHGDCQLWSSGFLRLCEDTDSENAYMWSLAHLSSFVREDISFIPPLICFYIIFSRVRHQYCPRNTSHSNSIYEDDDGVWTAERVEANLLSLKVQYLQPYLSFLIANLIRIVCTSRILGAA